MINLIFEISDQVNHSESIPLDDIIHILTNTKEIKLDLTIKRANEAIKTFNESLRAHGP